MKKLILITALAVVLSGNAVAVETATGNCEGGTEVVGKNGHSYCRSNVTMNWWSAFNWCKSQGRNLVTLENACDRKSIGSTCENLNLGISAYGWTSIASGESAAYFVYLGNGNVGAHPRTANYDALCF